MLGLGFGVFGFFKVLGFRCWVLGFGIWWGACAALGLFVFSTLTCSCGLFGRPASWIWPAPTVEASKKPL